MIQNITTFQIKQKDTLPALQINVKTRGYLDSIVPFNLSAVTACTFSMMDSCGSLQISSVSAVISSISGGTIQYNWIDGDTDNTGVYKAEFELTFSGGTKITIPTIGTIDVYILSSINGA